MAYKNLFFDLDDTIWDTSLNGKESLEEVYQDYDFGRFFPSFEEFYSVYFPNNSNLWKQYAYGKISKEELIYERFRFPLGPFGIEDRTFISNLNDDFLSRTTVKTKLLPHALEVLEYLRPNYKMLILSNGFKEVQHKKISNSSLSPYFDDIILSDDIGFTKPHPKIFEHALRKTNSTLEDRLMIGDNWNADIVGAKNSKMDQVWFDLGIEIHSGFEPTYRITSLLELKQIL